MGKTHEFGYEQRKLYERFLSEDWKGHEVILS